MKRRINRMFVVISLLAIALTTGLLIMVFYDLFCRRVITDLEDYAALVWEMNVDAAPEEVGQRLTEHRIRLTVVDNQGNVLYDNGADKSTMGNHVDRPEVLDALDTGEGMSVRHSETLAHNTFYYALRMENGNVLRVAKDVESVFSIFGRVFPTALSILILLILMGFGMSHLLTKKLILPIEKLAENMDMEGDSTDYEELSPFVQVIREQHRDILRSARIRQEFTANVSHELKTPLTAISGYAELIETGMASDEDVTRFARGIHSSSNRLLTLINDIIRLSELDSSESATSFEYLNLSDMAKSCVEMLQMNAEKHGVTISATGEGGYINGDKQMIEELLYNLCDNAIRYNNAGGNVVVSVKQESDKVVLTVKDTGIGIPEEHRERIFERFYRVDKSRSKSTGGTGLGLAIVKHIVARHDAVMELYSKVGKGTEIKVIFE